MQKIQFHFLDRTPALKERNKLKIFIEDLFKMEKKGLESLYYIFCSDEHLLKVNVEFLNHDFYTDVITFEFASAGSDTQGEVYISVDRIKDNANELGVSFKEELLRVIFHGALHLCGYKDKTKKDETLMREAENKYLQLYFR